MNKKRICFIIGVLSNTGGTERVCTMIANALCEKYDITILSTWHGGNPSFHVDENVHIDYLMEPWEGKVYHFIPKYFDWKYCRYLRQNKFDACIDVDICLAEHTVPALAETKTKIIEWCHFNYLHTASNPERLHCLELAKKHSSRIVVLTKQDLELHKEGGVPAELLAQIYNPLTFHHVNPSPRTQHRAIAVGRLTDQKGFDLLLRAWAKIKRWDSDWGLSIIGSGELEQSLRNLRDELCLESVEFIPATSNIESWYDKASVVLMSSRYEGFPMVLLESLSKGLPAIAFDCPTGPRELIDDGATGFLVSPEDGVGGFAEKTIELLNSKEMQERFSANALQKSKQFGIESIKQQWIDLLDQVIDE